MPGFSKDGFRQPFGRNVFLRNTRFKTITGGTFDRTTIPPITIDGFGGQKILQPGVILAKITAGPNTGKVGPYQPAGTDEVQTITPSGTWSGGTYTLTSGTLTTAPIPYNATAATATAALVTAGITNITLTGGPLSTGAFTVTYTDYPGGIDEGTIAINTTSVTGSSPAAAVTTGTPGVAGATDGRGVSTNIIGINNTFLPAQLMDRDVEVACIIEGTVVQANVLHLNAAGLWVAPNDTVAGYLNAKKGMNILFV